MSEAGAQEPKGSGDPGAAEDVGREGAPREPEAPAPGARLGPPGAPKPTRPEAEALARIQRERRVRVAKALLALVVVVLLIVFVIQNSQTVKVDFVFVSVEGPLIWTIVVSALLGTILGYLVGRPSRRARRARKPETPSRRAGDAPGPS